ncbi:MAG: hypothetical protein M9923_00090 [Phycicoccus sp.]|uniref:hypothetical protein n=1 Tax=Phycicoccus sp. TaxID=1902410 RepID=UPI00259094C9|nr:hypothetical protein [Phycicoccus sp.]MCO5301618.1 hypothetical protein [Phycicoccus sp.]
MFPRKATLEGQKMARESSIARRGFGRIERRESGRYRAAYTGPDGRLYRAPTTFDAKEDAVAWLANRRAEIQMEVWAPDAAARGASRKAVPTMRTYGDQWLEGRKTRGRELRPTTRQQYRMLLDIYIYQPSATSGSTGSRPTTSRSGTTRSRLARRRSGRRPTACSEPSSARRHQLDRSR